MPFLHRVFGLRLRSNLPLPGLDVVTGGDPDADLEVRLGTLPQGVDLASVSHRPPWYRSRGGAEGEPPPVEAWKIGDGSHIYLRYFDGVQFVIDRGAGQLWGDWPATGSLDQAAHHLIFSLPGFILALRGIPCLTGASVSIEGRGIALVGASRTGKSTLCAALAARGCSVLSDDLLPLTSGPGGFEIQPGYPWLGLRPESVDLLRADGLIDGRPQSLPDSSWEYWGESFVDLRLDSDVARFRSRPAPLRAIYLLSWAERNDIEDVSDRQALLELLAAANATRPDVPDFRTQELEQLSKVVSTLPVRRLRRSTEPHALETTCRLLLADQGVLDEPRLPGTPATIHLGGH